LDYQKKIIAYLAIGILSERNKIIRATSLGVYRFWRDLGFVLGAVGIGFLADTFNLSIALEGFLRIISVHIKELKRVPDFTTMWWRVSRINIKLNPLVHLNEDIVIAVDFTGIKVANRGEWIRRHHHHHDKYSSRKGFIKIHVAVDTKSKLILSMKVTKEDVGDGRMLKSLVKNASINVQQQQANIQSVLADGAYDSRDNFQFLHDSDIDPAIKVRKNSSIKSMGRYARKMAVLQQLSDLDKRYGRRWVAETVFSSMKRIFGKYVISTKWKNIVSGGVSCIYNMFMHISQ
jgi:hypothetical protein